LFFAVRHSENLQTSDHAPSIADVARTRAVMLRAKMTSPLGQVRIHVAGAWEAIDIHLGRHP
jgi:hypothetical protein